MLRHKRDAMKCTWHLEFYFVLTLMVMSLCHAGRHRRMSIPRENNGAVRLQHGAFQCMGALLTPRTILTCCTCISDVFFSCHEDNDQVTYEVRALSVENITVKSEEEKKVAGKDVFIHPQCDIDGTCDYGLITLVHGISGKGDCLTRRHSSRTQLALPGALEVRKKLKQRPTGICRVHTILDDSSDGEIVEIFTQFVDWRNCWNGSETKPAFEAKYCMRTLDPQMSLENGKCGSPVFCEGKLVGILARRYALGGKNYASVNGLDGAIEFIRETVKLDIREESSEEEAVDPKKMNKHNRKRKSHQQKRNT